MPLYTQPKSESYSNIQILECVAKKSHDPHRWKMTPPMENDRRPPSVEMRSIEEIRKETPTVEIKSDKVDVYWNINKGCFSVKDCKTNRVTMYTDAIEISDAQFIVRRAGRERVLREQQKNVHAFVRGYITTNKAKRTPSVEIREAKYNPYKNESFVDKHTDEPVHAASVVDLFTNSDNKGDIRWVK